MGGIQGSIIGIPAIVSEMSRRELALPIRADRSIVFQAGFVDQHHRDIVANRIDAFAGGAFQSASIGGQFYGSFVQRTYQNIEQFLRYRHLPPISFWRTVTEPAIQGNCQDFVALSGVQVFPYLAPCSTFSASLPFHCDPGANSTGHTAMICEP